MWGLIVRFGFIQPASTEMTRLTGLAAALLLAVAVPLTGLSAEPWLFFREPAHGDEGSWVRAGG